jgi:hypothetical protein
MNEQALRLTPEDIEAAIESEHYFSALQGARMSALDAINETLDQTGQLTPAAPIAPHNPELGLLTFCVLVLKNGFKVTGESACASPSIFDPVKGREYAREKALQKVWEFEGYLLKEKLAFVTVDGRIE